MTKLCSKCGKDLPLSEFNPDRRTALGVGSQCKACNRARMKIYAARADVKARRAEYGRKYRAENRNRLAEKDRRWRAANRENIQAKRMAYYQANREKIIAYIREYNRKNRETINAKARAYYANHRPECLARSVAWRRKNYQKHLESCRKRTALKRAAGVDRLTAAQWEAIKEAFKFRCAYCGRKPKRLTQDHVKALMRGGPHISSNVVPACAPCNSKKWANPAPTLHWRGR